MGKKMLILVTNDDGVHAKGLHALVECVSHLGDVIVVAPDEPRSGASSALTVGMPLRITAHADSHGARVYSVSGTPVDCVKLALDAIVPRKPDMLLSGINHGSNSGTCITYSGTMGAVMEGCMQGIPSIGFSLLHHSLKADFSLSAPLVTDIVERAIANPLPPLTALNVNIPALMVPKGARVCRAAHGCWTEEYARYLDPSGAPFYLLTGHFVNAEPEATDTDEHWLAEGYASVVPVTPDQTMFQAIAPLSAIYDI